MASTRRRVDDGGGRPPATSAGSRKGNTTVDSDAQGKGANPADVAWRGIELCRQGDWKEGLYWLSMAAGAKEKGGELPSLFYAYMGYGIARYQGKRQEGLKLTKHAVELEFYQPENYYFLARTHLLLKDRRAAISILERGLQVDSSHQELLSLRQELGERRLPMLPFLHRGHLLNRMLGKLRHRLLKPKEAKSEEGAKAKKPAPRPRPPAAGRKP